MRLELHKAVSYTHLFHDVRCGIQDQIATRSLAFLQMKNQNPQLIRRRDVLYLYGADF